MPLLTAKTLASAADRLHAACQARQSDQGATRLKKEHVQTEPVLNYIKTSKVGKIIDPSWCSPYLYRMHTSIVDRISSVKQLKHNVSLLMLLFLPKIEQTKEHKHTWILQVSECPSRKSVVDLPSNQEPHAICSGMLRPISADFGSCIAGTSRLDVSVA